MGFWRTVFAPFAGSDPSAQFSSDESGPMPVDQLWLFQGMRDIGKVDRDRALTVTSVLRGRNLICSSTATLPLVQYARDGEEVRLPLLEQIDPDVPNVVTVSQTLEDLFFEGIAWWEVIERDANDWPVYCRHRGVTSVSLNPPNTTRSPAPLPGGYDPRGASVWVDGREVAYRDMIRFDSPNPGLLKAAGRAIRLSLLLDERAEMAANEPPMKGFFSPKEGVDPQETAVTRFLKLFGIERKKSGIGYIPAALDFTEMKGTSLVDLQLVEQQKRADLQIANALGLDPEDLGISTTSRTYQNDVNRRQDRINDVLRAYMRAVTDRLSMSDVTKRGYRVEFDLDDYMRADPTTRVQYYEKLHALGAITTEEIRKEERMPQLGVDVRPPIKVPATVERRALEMSADDGEVFTFSDMPTATVDLDARTITGLAVPYGKVAISQGRRYRFAPGSLTYSDLSRVKLLREHDWSQSLGRAIAFTETPQGVVMTFKIARGPEGDRALLEAEDGAVDGLSIGPVFSTADTIPDPENRGVSLVNHAVLREVSLTPKPAFDDSRLTSVKASRSEGDQMKCATCGTEHAPSVACPTTPEQTATTFTNPPTETRFSLDELRALGILPAATVPQPVPGVDVPEVREPVKFTASTEVNEGLPYRFSYEGGKHVFRSDAEHDFSTDLFAVLSGRESGRDVSGPMARVNEMISAAFADIDRADITALTPNRHRPDMWQPQMDYATPLWDMINSGSTDGTKFDVPKYNSSSGLVGPATESVEPASGTMTATLQTITPSQVWGKVEITRQAWRAGGSPQLSGILWDQMLREYFEDREAAVATFLNTLTAAADITLTGRPATTPDNDDDRATASDLEAAIADLQFVRGGNRFRAFAVHQDLYRLLARVKDSSGRPLYPQINPQNANGTAANLFSTLNVAGTIAVPSWALGAGGQTTPTNSWLFDPAKVRGWASAPERLFWDFGATVQTGNVPQLSYVTLGIYGDVAFANLDINGVRQVTFDPSV